MSNASSNPPQTAPVVELKNQLTGQQGPLNMWWLALVAIVAVAVIYFASQIIGGAVIYAYASTHHWSSSHITSWVNNSVAAQFVYIAIAEGLTLLGLWVMLKLYRWKWSTIGLTKPKLSNVGWGLGAVIPYYVIYLVIVSVVSSLIPALKVDQQQDIGFNSVHGPTALILTFISLVILPPIVEEIAMRGFLYTSLKKWLPRVVSALLVSALFGSAHLAEGGSAGPLWIGAIDTFTLSLVLCYLREKTDSLWAGITLHATKNLIAFVTLFIIGTR